MVLELTGNISWSRLKTTPRMQKVSPKQILKRIFNLVQQLSVDQLTRGYFFPAPALGDYEDEGDDDYGDDYGDRIYGK